MKQQSNNTTDKTKAWDKIRLLKVRFECKVIMKGNKQNFKMFGEYIICWLYFSKMKIIWRITKRKPVYSHEYGNPPCSFTNWKVDYNVKISYSD